MNPDLLSRLFTVPPVVVMAVLFPILIVAAIFDIRSRRIPNWLTLGGILLGIVVNLILGPPDGGALFALKGLALGFGLYMGLYMLRAMGAGDVKLMGAVGAFTGAERWFGIFLVTAILGGIAAFVLILTRGRVKRTLFNVGFILSEMRHGRPAYVGKEELDVRSKKAIGLPHGAVIAGAVAIYVVLAARMIP
jgi:prepilin peptidase CpaA